MAAGRHQAPRPQRSGRRASKLGLVLSVILIFALSVGGTLAYIVTQTGDVTNSFAPSSVTCQVNSDSSVTNTGDIPAYIRASFAVNWVDGSGNIRGVPPAATDYTLTIDAAWIQGMDGFYYYGNSVQPNTSTSIFASASPKVAAPSGYSLKLTIAAEAIQAAGDTDVGSVPAYKDAWPNAPTLN